MKKALWTAAVAALFCCLLAISPAWDWIEARLHHVEPFTELQFFDGQIKRRPTYTLFFEGQTHLAHLEVRGDKLRATYDPSGRYAAFHGEGTMDYGGHSISFSSGQVRVDGTMLPPRPPFSVVLRSGGIRTGAFIRTFE